MLPDSERCPPAPWGTIRQKQRIRNLGSLNGNAYSSWPCPLPCVSPLESTLPFLLQQGLRGIPLLLSLPLNWAMLLQVWCSGPCGRLSLAIITNSAAAQPFALPTQWITISRDGAFSTSRKQSRAFKVWECFVTEGSAYLAWLFMKNLSSIPCLQCHLHYSMNNTFNHPNMCAHDSQV